MTSTHSTPAQESKLDRCFTRASELSGIPISLLKAIAKVESSMHPYALSIQTDRLIDKYLRKYRIRYSFYQGRKGRYLYSIKPTKKQLPIVIKLAKTYGKEYSVGLMQVSSTNFKLLKELGIRDVSQLLTNPCLNIKVGTLLFLECYRVFKNLKQGLLCYNGGMTIASGRKVRKHHVEYINKVLRIAKNMR